MKILSAECYGDVEDIFELEVLERLHDADPEHPGFRYIPRLIDSFPHVGPNGSHVCLVVEPMGESLAGFGTLFHKFQIPSPIMQRFTRQLFLALDYAHCSGVIHTGKQSDALAVVYGVLRALSRYQAPKHHGADSRFLDHRQVSEGETC